MKEYVVIAYSEADIDSIHADLIKDTSDSVIVDPDVIPRRRVDVANERLGNPRITHYFLTDEEAERLRNDPRVEDIHPLPDPLALHKTVVQKPVTFNGQIGNFNRNSAVDRYNINWGLRRTSLTSAEIRPGNSYEYDQTGTGVDIVIVDDGVMVDHTEFIDTTGQSRVQQIDWYKETGIPGKMPPNHYKCITPGSCEHGTHVASIAAGRNFGYAKNSRIYSIKIFGDFNEAISTVDVFDLIRVWHSNKKIDPTTKVRRPTVVNLSWAYSWEFPVNRINKIVYRNQVMDYGTGTRPQPKFGLRGQRHGIVVPSLDAELQEAEKAGVIFVHSAGNFGQKIDSSGGLDYNNYYTTTSMIAGVIPAGRPVYYHRGSSPHSANIIKVAAAKDALKFANGQYLEQIDGYSDRGPGCTVVAPGTNITAATSSSTTYTRVPYVWGAKGSNNFQFVSKQSGTSMAAPQVTGVVALYLGANPGATPAQTKEWISNISVENQLWTTNSNNDYTNPSSLLGGPNKYLYNPFRNNYRS